MIAATLAQALTDRLETITVANGYMTDIGLRVFRGKRRLDEQHIPCTILLEGDDRPTGSALRSTSIAQTYIIEAHANCDPDNPNDTAHKMIRDMKKAIFGADPFFGRTVKKIEYMGRTISPREDGLDVVAAGIEIELTYVEDLTNP